jgi:hypothetical protein
MNPFLAGSIAVIALLMGAAPPAAGDEGPDTLAWLDGHWCAESGGERVQEYWMPDHGGFRLGLSRTLKQEKTTAFEFLRIVIENGTPVYVAQPGGNAPVRFPRTAGGPRWIAFENRAHDFPQRIEYRRDGDRLSARIAGPGEGGKDLVIEFDYRRCKIGA